MNKVLFVDDEINVLNALKRGIIEEEYEAFFATSGQAALKILEKEKINVIVADMRMPVMDGIKLLKEVKKIDPDIVRIVLSGYSQLPQIIVAVNKVGVFKFILKPWEINELIADIRSALEYYNLKREAEKLKENLKKTSKMYDTQLELLQDKTMIYHKRLKEINVASQKMIDTIKWIVNNKMDSSFIDVLEKIYQELVLKSIFEQETFKTEQMMDEFHKYIKEASYNQVKIGLTKHSNQQYKGNYRLVFFAFSSILKYAIQDTDKKHQQIRILLDEKELEEQYAIINIYVVINSEKDCKSIIKHPAIFYLTALSKSYDLDIMTQKENNGVSIRFSMHVEKV